MHLKAHKFIFQQRLFSFIILLQIRWPIESKLSEVGYFLYFYVGMPQVKILVFYNYQTCPAPLICFYSQGSHQSIAWEAAGEVSPLGDATFRFNYQVIIIHNGNWSGSFLVVGFKLGMSKGDCSWNGIRQRGKQKRRSIPIIQTKTRWQQFDGGSLDERIE